MYPNYYNDLKILLQQVGIVINQNLRNDRIFPMEITIDTSKQIMIIQEKLKVFYGQTQ